MKLKTLFDQNTFVITGEVGPIKGAIHRDLTIAPTCAQEAIQLQRFVHGVNVTDNQSAVMRLGSLAASVKLKEKGIEPIYQLTCRDRNRIALQSDLLTAYSQALTTSCCSPETTSSWGTTKRPNRFSTWIQCNWSRWPPACRPDMTSPAVPLKTRRT